MDASRRKNQAEKSEWLSGDDSFAVAGDVAFGADLVAVADDVAFVADLVAVAYDDGSADCSKNLADDEFGTSQNGADCDFDSDFDCDCDCSY